MLADSFPPRNGGKKSEMGSSMSRDEDAERGRAELIDAEYETLDRAPRRGGGVSGGTAVLLAVLAASAGAAGGAIGPRLAPVDAALDSAFPAAADTQAQNDAEISAIAQRLAMVESVVNTPLGDDPTAARVFALQASLRQLEAQLAQMPSSAEVTTLVGEVRRLQEELPAVAAEARAAGTAARASYAVVAASEASRSSGSFEQAHAALAALLPDDANVAALAPLARVGAPTRNELRDRFSRLDNEIIRAAHQAQAGAGFWGRIQAGLAQWIVIRRSGEGDTPAGVVERAERALMQDNLAAAVEELNRLNGPSRRAAQPWIDDAARRLEIDQRMSLIRTELSRGA
jgi:hypothetical protein